MAAGPPEGAARPARPRRRQGGRRAAAGWTSPGDLRKGWRATPRIAGAGRARLTPCAVRPPEGLFAKRARGRMNHVDRDRGLAYWFRMNRNAVEARSIRRSAAATRAAFSRLMADPEVARLPGRAVPRRRAKVDEFPARPHAAARFGEIAAPRFRTTPVGRGPDVVPEDAAF